MSNELVVNTENLPSLNFSKEQVDLIKATVAKGTTDDEFALFLYVAKHTGLNPLLRQIHAVKRWDSKLQREAMAIQVGIDGYRLMADRTKNYAPGPEPVFVHDKDGKLVSATASVKKYLRGEWHTISATAFFSEYVQKTKEGKANSMWEKGGHFMLAKCAESLAIRKAFPGETAGVYGDEEMLQADNVPAGVVVQPIAPPVAKTGPKPEHSLGGEFTTITKLTANKIDGKPVFNVYLNENKYFTFDEKLATRAKEWKENGVSVFFNADKDGLLLELGAVAVTA